MAAKFTKETTKSAKFAEGGNGHMFGKQAAGVQKPGVTETDPKGGAPGAKFAVGGSGKMYGYSPSLSQRSGITSAR
jgi:hypothetical protein